MRVGSVIKGVVIEKTHDIIFNDEYYVAEIIAYTQERSTAFLKIVPLFFIMQNLCFRIEPRSHRRVIKENITGRTARRFYL